MSTRERSGYFSFFEVATEGNEQNQKQHTYRLDSVFFERLYRILKIILNSPHRAWSTEKQARQNSVFWLYIAFMFLSLGYEFLVTYVGMIPSKFYSILTTRDLAGFFKYLIPSMVLVFSIAAVKAFLSFMMGLFAIKTRRLLTKYVHNQYIRPKSMYAVVNHQDIDNPDQRITQDIDKFAETLSQIVTNLIIAPIMVIYYTYKCWSVTGFLGPLIIFLYFFLGTLVSQKLVQPIVGAVFFKELQEGNFRYLHVRLRQFAESIAFCGGEDEEHTRAQKSLDTLLAYQRTVVNKELPLAIANQSFAYIGSIFSYLIIAIPIFTGALDGKDATELSSIISANSFVFMYLIFLFTSIIEQSSKCSDLAGYTARIGEILETFDSVSYTLDNIEIDCPHRQDYSSDSIEFEDVKLVSPNSKVIVHDFNLKIKQGNHVAFVGVNGSGKTSILRALAGLWPCSEGRICMSRDVLFLPQVPYLIEGSLRDQMLYPNTSSIEIDNQKILELLSKVRLHHLTQLLDSFDKNYSHQEWNKFLSPGEQQRLVLARVFHRKPQFVVLDEATSAMDYETENYLYNALIKDNSITVISISHHPNVLQLHTTLVRLDGQGNYRIEDNDNKQASLVTI